MPVPIVLGRSTANGRGQEQDEGRGQAATEESTGDAAHCSTQKSKGRSWFAMKHNQPLVT